MTCAADRHDTLDAYMHYKCRCPAARAKHTLRMKRYRLRRMAGERPWVEATGTRRRIQALVAIGWLQTDLGRRLGGVTNATVSSYASPSRKFVFARTAAAVAALYDELADTPGPSHYNAVRMRNRGWLPPLWWDDDTIDDPTYQPVLTDAPRGRDDVDPVVVDRLVEGSPFEGRATFAEKALAYRRLVANRAFYADIQEQLKVNSITMRELARLADAASIEVAA